jgi:hypothetical protein
MQDNTTIGIKRNGDQRSDDMTDLFKDDVRRPLSKNPEAISKHGFDCGETHGFVASASSLTT